MILPAAARRGVLLVTGTDTDAGKTCVTAAIAREELAAGTDLVVVKPTQTGLQPGEEGDVQLVGRLAGLAPERCYEPVRLPEPLAPTTAGRRAGIPLPSMAEQAATVAGLARHHDLVVVEGAGGVTVGLDDAGAGLLELADALRALGITPHVLVVVRSVLGTLNHSKLTVDALRARGNDVAGMIIGSWPEEPDLAERCNVEELEEFVGVPLLGGLAAGAGAGPEALADAWRRPEELV